MRQADDTHKLSRFAQGLQVDETLSWYCERIVGELSWLPAERALRVSTLTMWGERCDLDLPHQVLLAQGFAPTPAREYDEYPVNGFVPLQLDGKTYMVVWGRKHVIHADALANLLVHQALPFSLSSASQGQEPNRSESSYSE